MIDSENGAFLRKRLKRTFRGNECNTGNFQYLQLVPKKVYSMSAKNSRKMDNAVSAGLATDLSSNSSSASGTMTRQSQVNGTVQNGI